MLQKGDDLTMRLDTEKWGVKGGITHSMLCRSKKLNHYIHIILQHSGIRGNGLIRAFIAVDLPAEIRENIGGILSELDGVRGVRAVKPSGVHITLKFLGDTREEVIPALTESLEGVCFSPFSCSLNGVGVFPSPVKPRVLWIGAEGPFADLHARIETALSGMGFEKDRREFTAHATVGRVKFLRGEAKNVLADILAQYRDTCFGEFGVTGFRLKKSTLSPEGAVYETLHEVRF
jgi:2'-5' RNA ligase